MVAIPFYLASVGLVVAGLLGFQSFWIWLVACFVAAFLCNCLKPNIEGQ